MTQTTRLHLSGLRLILLLTLLSVIGVPCLAAASPAVQRKGGARVRLAVVGFVHGHGLGILSEIVKNPEVDLVG
ncbi:MAG TPA: hypothetical protein VJX67_13200, partial [Blastocatellia bacterium]|nr:hypothetical protein [Blastocatellia bacterium]